MATILTAPGKYVQGPGELKKIADYVTELGKNVLCLISENGKKRFGKIIDESFAGTDAKLRYDIFNGECSRKEIARLIDVCKANDIDVVMGVGGGKIFDTIKAVAYYTKIPVVIVPTIAGSDAPCSALSVIYTDDGVFEKYLFLPSNPNVVLVDTDIIAQSPTRLLVSGMGDALATYFEARACDESQAQTCAGGTATRAAMNLAELCYDTLINEGVKAKAAADRNVATKALEDIVEANTLLSGIGFESGGLATAHAVHNGLTAIPETHNKYHGEKVAFGTLVQLILENAELEELLQVLDFCVAVGLPVTLEELGIVDVDLDKIKEVAELAASSDDTAVNMPFEVTPESIFAAIVTADEIGKKHKEAYDKKNA